MRIVNLLSGFLLFGIVIPAFALKYKVTVDFPPARFNPGSRVYENVATFGNNTVDLIELKESAVKCSVRVNMINDKEAFASIGCVSKDLSVVKVEGPCFEGIKILNHDLQIIVDDSYKQAERDIKKFNWKHVITLDCNPGLKSMLDEAATTPKSKVKSKKK